MINFITKQKKYEFEAPVKMNKSYIKVSLQNTIFYYDPKYLPCTNTSRSDVKVYRLA